MHPCASHAVPLLCPCCAQWATHCLMGTLWMVALTKGPSEMESTLSTCSNATHHITSHHIALKVWACKCHCCHPRLQ